MKKLSKKQNFIIAINYFEEALIFRPAFQDLKIESSKANSDSLRKLIELKKR